MCGNSCNSLLAARMLYKLPFRGKRLLFSPESKLAVGPTRLRIQCVRGLLSSGIRRLGYEADHSPPSSVEVKNEWNWNSTPSYAFAACTATTLLWIYVAYYASQWHFLLLGPASSIHHFRNNSLRAILLETTDLLDLLKWRCVHCVVPGCPAENKKN